MNLDKCIICGSDECKGYVIEINSDGVVEKWKYECKYCGKYEINDNEKYLLDLIKTLKGWWKDSKYENDFLENLNRNLYKIQCYVRERNDVFNETLYLTEEKIKNIINLSNKTMIYL